MRKYDFITLEGRSHGRYEYPDLLVAKYRLGCNDKVKRIAKNYLGLDVKNTAKENNGHKYIGEINWKNALSLNLHLGYFNLNPRQLIDLWFLLDSEKVFDGNGKKIDSLEVRAIKDEIFRKRSPWRGEHLDAGFLKISEEIRMAYDNILGKYGELSPGLVEAETCLMKDCYVDLKPENFNKQGLPKINAESKNQRSIQGQNIFFWYPRENSVAGFNAIPGRACLSCSRDLQDSDSGLGVRSARKK